MSQISEFRLLLRDCFQSALRSPRLQAPQPHAQRARAINTGTGSGSDSISAGADRTAGKSSEGLSSLGMQTELGKPHNPGAGTALQDTPAQGHSNEQSFSNDGADMNPPEPELRFDDEFEVSKAATGGNASANATNSLQLYDDMPSQIMEILTTHDCKSNYTQSEAFTADCISNSPQSDTSRSCNPAGGRGPQDADTHGYPVTGPGCTPLASPGDSTGVPGTSEMSKGLGPQGQTWGAVGNAEPKRVHSNGSAKTANDMNNKVKQYSADSAVSSGANVGEGDSVGEGARVSSGAEIGGRLPRSGSSGENTSSVGAGGAADTASDGSRQGSDASKVAHTGNAYDLGNTASGATQTSDAEQPKSILGKIVDAFSGAGIRNL